MEIKWFCIFLAILALAMAGNFAVGHYTESQTAKNAMERGYIQKQMPNDVLIWVKP
jgi:hypothetical protein